MSYSKSIVIGRFVADPEIKSYGSEGQQLATFRLAANLYQDKSAFYNCIAFGNTVKTIADYCKKGKQVMVEGYFQNNDYDKEVGGQTVRMYTLELNVQRLVLLGDAQGNNAPSQPQQRQQQQAPAQNQGFGGFGQQSAPQQQQQAPANPFSGFGSGDDLPF